MIDIAAIKSRFETLEPFLTERDRCLFAAGEARAAGRGGIAAISAATGIARNTIGRGLVDLGLGATTFGAQVCRSGGESKPATETQPGLLNAPRRSGGAAALGQQEPTALAERGFTAGQNRVDHLLKQLGFSMQANSKTPEGATGVGPGA